ncbi:MAG: NTP transferase domain-containing protein [Pseudorhizobium sp.]
MQFRSVEIGEAVGCVLVHSIRLPSGRMAKGTVLSAAHVEALVAAGTDRVAVVRLEDGDLLEDDAAAAIAAAFSLDAIRLSEAATGRVNLHATANGLFVVDREVIDALNRIDPAITLATLADHTPVQAGDMVATVKIIPLAVSGATVEAAVDLLEARSVFSVRPYRPRKVLLIATELPALKPSVMDRTAKLLQRRLDPSASRLIDELRIPHDQERLTEALVEGLARPERPELMIVFGASAVADPQDVIPAAIRAAGGIVEHVGMPVDPGNLLVLGRIDDVPVIGAPGCARSPKENGFDWILNRILAGERPTRHDITGMGVGGLLMEIASRPLPREAADRPLNALRVGGLLLAAGQARRMGEGGPHKLLAEFDGVPLVRQSAEVLQASQAEPAVIVVGHRRDEIEASISGLGLKACFNPDYPTGLGSSLVCGFSAPELGDADGVLVMLADMPGVTTAHIDQLVEAFRDAGGHAIVRATYQGKRGNPIILPRATFDAVRKLEGDVGARAIIESSGLPIIEIDIGPAAHLDVDTPEAVTAAGGILKE